MAAEELIDRAREALARRGWEPDLDGYDPASTQYELEMHRVELELQNESLHETRERLDRTLERYRALFDLAPVSLVTLDADARVVDANERANALLDRELHQLEGRPLSAFIRAKDAEQFELFLRRVRRAGPQPEQEECVFVRPNGRRLRVQMTALPINDRGETGVVLADLGREAALARWLAEVCSTEQPNRPATILIVDDHELARNAFAAILQAEGYEVIGASCVAEALDLVPDELALLVTDVRLPDGAGPDIVAALERHHPNLPVVYCSGLPHGAVIEDYGVPEDGRFFRKPFDVESFVTEVLSLAKQSSQR